MARKRKTKHEKQGEKETYVDIIREIRQERSEAAARIVKEAERLGVPRRAAMNLATRILLYEITPEEAIRELHRIARARKKGKRAS